MRPATVAGGGPARPHFFHTASCRVCVGVGTGSKQVRRIVLTRHLLMTCFGDGGEAHEPAQPDPLATAAPPAPAGGDLGRPPVAAYPRRPGIRRRPPPR